MEFQAMVTTNEKDFEKQTLLLDDPKADEVLVKIVASGVCHTDATVLDGTLPVPRPALLGHEGSGIVVKVGSNVTTVQEGDHVVLGFAYCGHCHNCLDGNAGGCENMIQLNFSGRNKRNETPIHTHDQQDVSQFFGQSSFGTYATVDEKNVIKVDKETDLRYLGPFGCGLMTGSGTVLNSLAPAPGTSFVVFGTGAVGLSGLMAAKIAGCDPIIAVDIHDSRLELAKELGATHVINSKHENPAEKIKEITEGKGAHYSFETTGVPEVTLAALHCLRVKGTCATVAVGKRDLTFNVTNDLMLNALTLKGVIEGDAVPQLFIPKLVKFFKNGQFPVEKLAKFYELEDIEQAFEDSKNGSTIKPILILDKEYRV
ncbi:MULTISPECIES: NAD(P)-dependent alcohol dehydrogenase [Bacillus]|uniref:NAD(P)-dependent alcohol dehydrogenase n=1 Tax=Bacillus TaxID=1386 RepID=UPI000D01818C|nr:MULTISPECIES: NAD(P)-dependent alcohol dehydrogenase [Bacillus]MDR0124590.1 NAD(P)-dependent alcohol dehydrogenase [Bacillus zhangzhouensis]PRO41022.1 aryl-alcohol dehydrogenase [Bacillus sp. LLTC93]